MKRIFFLNRFYAPDHSATSQLVSDVAAYLASCGHEIHVITSRPSLTTIPAGPSPARRDDPGGAEFHRIATTQFGRSKLVGRAIDYLSFYASTWRKLRTATQPGDVLVAMTDPPLISVVAMGVAGRRRVLLVNWLQDIYPEIAVQLGVPFLTQSSLA